MVLVVERPASFVGRQAPESDSVQSSGVLGWVHVIGVVVDDPVDATEHKPLGCGRQQRRHDRLEGVGDGGEEVADISPGRARFAPGKCLVDLSDLDVAEMPVGANEIEPRPEDSNRAMHLGAFDAVADEVLASGGEDGLAPDWAVEACRRQQSADVGPAVRDAVAGRLVDSATPGNTEETCRLTRAVSCSRSVRLNSRTTIDTAKPPWN